MGKQHTIELNGKRYDALTGKVITNEPVIKSKPADVSPNKDIAKNSSVPVARKRMDGFSFPTHKTEKSKTLMRQTVQKPAVQKPANTEDSSLTALHKVKSAKQVSAKKLARASLVPTSTLVQRFGHAEPSNPPKLAPQLVTPTPSTKKTATATAAKANPITDGLAKATSHEQVKLKRPPRHAQLAHRLRISPRLLSGGAFVVAALLIGGFFAYQNIPNLNMRLAAARSGVHGNLPGYQPAGFGINGSIIYKPGQITVGYKSHTDNRNYKLTQSASAWNSESLLNNYVATNRRNYQTVQDKGKTVYIYDGSNATWVDGGIWYRVEGNSQLNSEQLQSIANSL